MTAPRDEQALLNFYRASELYGGLVLGQLARRTRDPQLMVELMKHAAEEIVHGQLWTETMLALGMRPTPTRDTCQRRYAEAVGAPVSVIQVLALTQVFERRVYRHFQEHLRRPGTSDVVRGTLRRMLDEEVGHLTWVKAWLDREAKVRPQLVREAMARYTAIDARLYDEWRTDYGWDRAA